MDRCPCSVAGDEEAKVEIGGGGEEEGAEAAGKIPLDSLYWGFGVGGGCFG